VIVFNFKEKWTDNCYFTYKHRKWR